MHAGRARAFWIADRGRGEIRDEAVPPPSAGDVVVRALYSGRGNAILPYLLAPGGFTRWLGGVQADSERRSEDTAWRAGTC